MFRHAEGQNNVLMDLAAGPKQNWAQHVPKLRVCNPPTPFPRARRRLSVPDKNTGRDDVKINQVVIPPCRPDPVRKTKPHSDWTWQLSLFLHISRAAPSARFIFNPARIVGVNGERWALSPEPSIQWGLHQQTQVKRPNHCIHSSVSHCFTLSLRLNVFFFVEDFFIFHPLSLLSALLLSDRPPLHPSLSLLLLKR